MQDFAAAFREAFALVVEFDSGLFSIIALSLRVSLTAVLIACLIGIPMGALMALTRFPGHSLATILISALMGLPPVVVGLLVYLGLSSAGPFGVLQLLYTPAAMIIAQTILVTPIIAALAQQVIHDLNREYDEMLRSMGASRSNRMMTLIWDARFALVTAALAGTGRALAEVGAVMIVGGNIDHVTRVMTTAIALETARGDLAMALGLGVVLVVLALLINGALQVMRISAEARAYA